MIRQIMPFEISTCKDSINLCILGSLAQLYSIYGNKLQTGIVIVNAVNLEVESFPEDL